MNIYKSHVAQIDIVQADSMLVSDDYESSTLLKYSLVESTLDLHPRIPRSIKMQIEIWSVLTLRNELAHTIHKLATADSVSLFRLTLYSELNESQLLDYCSDQFHQLTQFYNFDPDYLSIWTRI